MALIVFAHIALFENTIIHTDGNLFNALGSVDGFFTDVLGPYFYVIIGLLYAVEIYLLLQDKRKYLLPVLSAGLLIYYIAGYPGYYNILLDYQTYPWLSKQVAETGARFRHGRPGQRQHQRIYPRGLFLAGPRGDV